MTNPVDAPPLLYIMLAASTRHEGTPTAIQRWVLPPAPRCVTRAFASIVPLHPT